MRTFPPSWVNPRRRKDAPAPEGQTTILRVSEALKETARPTKQLVHRPRFRLALYSGIGALAAFVVGSAFDHHPNRTLGSHLVVAAPALAFVLLGVICIRSVAIELDEFFRWRGGQTAGSAVRMMVTVVGYVLLILAAFDLLDLPVGHLLVGGAIAGVVLGIAAQQSLGNLFSGLVLMLARPFQVGSYIRVRSGALGGEFQGRVLNMGLTYVTIVTPDGTLKVPNSSLLAAAVGPWPAPDETRTDGKPTRTDGHANPWDEVPATAVR